MKLLLLSFGIMALFACFLVRNYQGHLQGATLIFSGILIAASGIMDSIEKSRCKDGKSLHGS